MHTHRLALAAVLAASINGAATAQATTAQATTAMTAAPTAAPAPPQPVAAGAVGRWLHDAQGHIIGSVRALADNGQTVVLMIGSYFQPGSHEARVPARALALNNGHVTLQAEMAEALNLRTRR